MPARDLNDSEDDHDFNLGILCCLPKKKTGDDPEHGEYYAADATRPLTIVNIERPFRNPRYIDDTHWLNIGSHRKRNALAMSRLSVLTMVNGREASAA